MVYGSLQSILFFLVLIRLISIIRHQGTVFAKEKNVKISGQKILEKKANFCKFCEIFSNFL